MEKHSSNKLLQRFYLILFSLVKIRARLTCFIKNNKFILVLLSAEIICLMLMIMVFSPGYLSADSLSQLEQAISGRFNDWHPVMYSLIWRFLIVTTGKFQLMLVLQLLILCSSFLALSLVMYSKTKLKCFSLLLALSPLLPFIASIAGIMWKDVFMSFILLAVSVILVYLKLLKNIGDSITKKLYYIALLLLFFGASFRHNSVTIVLVLGSYIVYNIMRINLGKLKIVLLSALSGLVLAAGVLIFNSSIGVVLNVEDSKPDIIVYVDTITRNTSREEINNYTPLSLESREYLNLLEDTCGSRMNSISFCTSLQNYEEMIHKFSTVEYSAIKKLYLKSIIDHPILYLKVQSNLFYQFLTTKHPYAWHPGIDTPAPNTRIANLFSNNRGKTLDCQPCYNGAHTYYERALADFGFQFKPYFWILLGITVIAYSIKNRYSLSLVLSVSGILYIFSYIPFIPAYDYRYSYASVLLIYISILYLIIDTFKKGENSGPKT